MSRRIAVLSLVLLLAGFIPRLCAQDQTDTLSPNEVQQIRNSAMYPNDRIKFFLKFTQERVDTLKHLADDDSAEHRLTRISDKLQEFTSLCDEMQDNIDSYGARHADIRKALKRVVAQSEKWPGVLRSLPRNKDYDFSVDTALDSAQSAAQDAKQLLGRQEVYFKIHKKERNRNGSGPF